MKKEPFIQNLLVAHAGEDKSCCAKVEPKDSKTEDMLENPKLIKDSFVGIPTSPFDLFENVTTGSNSIKDGARE